MRIKLSYTVEAEDVLKETAKIVNLSTGELAQYLNRFQEVQEELAVEEEVVNIPKVLQMIEENRQGLLALDTRLLEVSEIIMGYQQYQLSQRMAAEEPDSSAGSDE